jgi:very-short-patch-repair endonuclease
VEYKDIRCAACGTWRTALVGYNGACICLTCGASVERGGRSSSLTRFSAGAWMDHLFPRADQLGAAQRRERLREWLTGQSVSLPDAYVDVLAHCERASEVRFALPVVTLSTWHPVGEKSFSDGQWTLRLQHPVLGERVDFALQGPGSSRAVLVEIDGAETDADARRASHLRTLELQSAGYPVLCVPSARAEERGSALRQLFMREALQVIERAPARPEPGRGLARTRRLWSRHELVYDASGLPLEERRELVEDWLRSRGEQMEEWQLDFLAHCHRAAEVHFVLPFLRLPNAEPVDTRTVHLDPWHTLMAQVPVDDYPLDFSFMTALQAGAEVVTTLVEIHPARGPRDAAEEARRRREWHRQGHTVVELAAAEAAERGRKWAEALLGETRERRERDAG